MLHNFYLDYVMCVIAEETNIAHWFFFIKITCDGDGIKLQVLNQNEFKFVVKMKGIESS